MKRFSFLFLLLFLFSLASTTYASVLPLTGTLTLTGSGSYQFNGTLDTGELASASPDSILSVSPFMSAGDIIIALMLFALILLQITWIFFRQI